MKRLITISVVMAAGLTALVVASAFLLGPGPHAVVQSALDSYARAKLEAEKAPLDVEFISRAAHPERFTRAMSARSYADSLFFQTDAAFRPNAARATSGKPLPFPPEDVWCVRLWRANPDRVPHYVFVVKHNDLYNSDWVLHEPTTDARGARAILDEIQCAP